jgi:glutamate/tyrosine decarboxylase-like PLP-dependent enzyme
MKHLSSFETTSVAATASAAELRARICLPLNDAGIDSTVVIDELVQAVEGGLIGSAGPRFFGWVIGGSLPAALAADWLTSAWDQNSCLYACAPAAALVEEATGVWLKELLGLPAEASFALVTGCQMAHVTCMAAARNRLMARRGWDVEAEGLVGAPAIRIVTSTERHATVLRAVRLLGIGEKHIVALLPGDDGKLTAETLRTALEGAPEVATIVVLQAGDLHLGAFDPFPELIAVAREFGAWVHVDGAFGLWAGASEKMRHLVEGVGGADSWATDGHKWLNVPYDCGYAFVADRVAHRAAFSVKASYITLGGDARDQMDWNPEWSRRARGFATYAALRELGRAGVAEMIERTCALTTELVAGIGALDGAEALCVPQINQGMVRFQPLSGDADAFTDRVIAGILASGEAFFTGTTWRGKRAMRVSVSNWQTTAEDVVRVIRCVDEVLRGLR